MAQERARDQYDAKNYAAARLTGQVLGTGVQLAALGPLDGLLAGGARIAQATPLLAREVAALGAVGGGLGVGGQVLSDVGSRHLGSLGDYAAATLGGAINAVGATRLGPGKAGAAGAAATSVLQDVLNGRPISAERAGRSAAEGGYGAALVGAHGRAAAAALSRKAKEEMGEFLSKARTQLRLDKTINAPKSREYLPGGRYTYPDQRTASGGLVEAKFGPSARLSPNQRAAHEQLGSYRVDHWLPKDVGSILGVPVGLLEFRFAEDGRALKERQKTLTRQAAR